MPDKMVPTKISSILVAVDGSSFAELAGMRAADLSQKYSADLILLYVAHYPANDLGVGASHAVAVGLPLTDPVTDKLKQGALDSMKKITAFAHKLGITTDEQVIDTSSSIVDTIDYFAYRNSVELIVIGDRGMNVFKSAPTGSVTEGILQRARCSVMVVR